MKTAETKGKTTKSIQSIQTIYIRVYIYIRGLLYLTLPKTRLIGVHVRKTRILCDFVYLRGINR